MSQPEDSYDSIHHNSKQCMFCRNFNEFEIPDFLINELLSDNVILFAGAGISTEGKMVYPYTLYEDISCELGISVTDKIPFSDLMTKYCAQPNGRAKLLRKIRDRFEYIRSFPELYRNATRFHYELATFYFIESIVTTNWDDYFERECAASPFVTSEDFVFWSIPGRKVFKIHGSISNLGSIVATTEDYEKCYERLHTGLLGSNLKTMLATRTVLYVGYSFSDEDFIRIHSVLRKEMGQLMPHSFIVTLDREGEKRFLEIGLTPIFTDATHFISVLKQHLIEDGHMIADSIFEQVRDKLSIVRDEHERLWEEFDLNEAVDILYTTSYQDGLIHAFERILARQNSGYYSHICNITKTLRGYEELRRDKVKSKKYQDVAYIEGYTNGLLYLVFEQDTREALPLYYVYGSKEQPKTFEEFRELRRHAFEFHKSAHRYAERIAQQQEQQKGLEIHHPPFLL